MDFCGVPNIFPTLSGQSKLLILFYKMAMSQQMVDF